MIVGAWVYSAFLGLFITLFIIISVFLILLVLIQKGRGGGLASAFGGGGGNTAFGSKTGDVLTWATSIVFGIFLFLAVILNLMTRQVTARPVAGGPTAPAQQVPAPAPAPTGDPLGSFAAPPSTSPAATQSTGGGTPAPAPTPTPAPATGAATAPR